jgi:hypothetical protein
MFGDLNKNYWADREKGLVFLKSKFDVLENFQPVARDV